jgi:hypothetical protein
MAYRTETLRRRMGIDIGTITKKLMRLVVPVSLSHWKMAKKCTDPLHRLSQLFRVIHLCTGTGTTCMYSTWGDALTIWTLWVQVSKDAEFHLTKKTNWYLIDQMHQ